MSEQFPPGALLRDSRNPNSIDIRAVSSEAEFVVVSAGGESRRYKRREAFLRRWLLPARTAVAIAPTVEHEQERGGIVIGLGGEPDPAGPWTYVVQTETGAEELPEQRLRVLKVDIDDPVARLEMNGWRGPRRFFARLGLLERTTVWKQDSEGIPAFLGARIKPLFHQFYAARRCLLDRETRFLLADEVGLGKTIEAGLVIQSLLAAKPDLRVLVVAPGTTSRQWLSELYSRFGGRVFTHVDAVRYQHGHRSRRGMEALLKSDRLIVTTSMLRAHPEAMATVTSQHWDLLVVDEGHHLANWPELITPLRRVSTTASGCLVLTATPGRGDDKGLLELLKLVAPSTYGHVTEGEFATRLEPQRKITEKLLYSEELVAALLARGEIEEEDARELAGHWKGIFPRDTIVVERLVRMEDGDGEAAEELVAHIQEHYRVDRRIIRTRRRTLREYGTHHASRELEHLEYEPCPAEVAITEQVADLLSRTDVPATWKAFWSRHACTTPLLLQHILRARLGAVPAEGETPGTDPLAADLGPAEEEAALGIYLARGPTFPGEKAWLEGTLAQAQRWCSAEAQVPGRFVALRKWLDRRIRAGREKTLVFSQSRLVVEELAAYLRAALGTDAVAVMTHDLSDDEIAEVALRFERRVKCLVLLSDEVGAEGRNFQFADAVVHLDQPSIVARIEQRIGRLDRIDRGLDRPVLSIAITGPSELEGAFLELHRDVFRVYERSIGGLEYLLPRFQPLILAAAAGGPLALRRLTEDLQAKVEAEEQRIDEAFSFFLDATRPELERAKKLADLVADRSGDEDESFVQDWCKELRIELIPQEDNFVKVEVRAEQLDAPLPGLGPGDWIKTGTFLRSAALNVPAVQYFAPGHLLVDALLQSAQETHDARATAFFRDLGAQGRGRVFVVIVGRLGPNEAAWQDNVPPGLLRRAEYYLPVEWVRSAFEILRDGEVMPVANGALLEGLRKDFQSSDRKCHPDHISKVVERFSGLWVGLRAAVHVANEAALAQKKDELDAAADELENVLRSELAYLRSQGQDSNADVTAAALRDREALLASVRFPSVVTDAVAIVVGGEGR
jgi:ATP-dependent helicase HepA